MLVECLDTPARVHPKLEGKRQSASNHPEIVARPVDHTPADVVKPAHVPHDSVLHANAELAPQLAAIFGMFSERHGVERVGCRRIDWTRDEMIAFSAAEDHANTSPGVRSEPRACNGIAQRERAQHRSSRPMVIGSIPNKRNTGGF